MGGVAANKCSHLSGITERYAKMTNYVHRCMQILTYHKNPVSQGSHENSKKVMSLIRELCSFYPRAKFGETMLGPIFHPIAGLLYARPTHIVTFKAISTFYPWYLLLFILISVRMPAIFEKLYDLEGYQGSNSYDAWIMHRFRLWMIYSITLTKIYWYKLAGYAMNVDQSIPTTFKSPLFIMCTCITAIIILNL
jgi:hypothetical protein